MDDRAYDRSRYDEADDRVRRLGRWLSKRPVESWLFFIAGVFVAGILF